MEDVVPSKHSARMIQQLLTHTVPNAPTDDTALGSHSVSPISSLLAQHLQSGIGIFHSSQPVTSHDATTDTPSHRETSKYKWHDKHTLNETLEEYSTMSVNTRRMVPDEWIQEQRANITIFLYLPSLSLSLFSSLSSLRSDHATTVDDSINSTRVIGSSFAQTHPSTREYFPFTVQS